MNDWIGNDFIKVSEINKVPIFNTNYKAIEYAQFHYEPSSFDMEISIGSFTPTRIFTYMGGYPNSLFDIIGISYANGKVTYEKDLSSNRCVVYFKDDTLSHIISYIVGLNGRDIGVGSRAFSVYNVALDIKSFINMSPRLIYMDISGLYIVPELGNKLEKVARNYKREGHFHFAGSVIKISAITGKRTLDDKDISNKMDKIFRPFLSIIDYNIKSFDTPLSWVLDYINKIFGENIPIPTPPTEIEGKKRIAEILDIPIELFSDHKGKLIDINDYNSNGKDKEYINHYSGIRKLYNSYKNQLAELGFETVQISRYETNTLKMAIHKLKYLVIAGKTEYIFDTSLEAQARRREIAMRPWM